MDWWHEYMCLGPCVAYVTRGGRECKAGRLWKEDDVLHVVMDMIYMARWR